MEIRIRESGQVMLEGEFRSLHPNTSFPIPLTLEIINEFGGDVVLEGPTPTTTRYQSVARDGIEQIGSDWFTKYKVVDFSDEAKASADKKAAKRAASSLKAANKPSVSANADAARKVAAQRAEIGRAHV